MCLLMRLECIGNLCILNRKCITYLRINLRFPQCCTSVWHIIDTEQRKNVRWAGFRYIPKTMQVCVDLQGIFYSKRIYTQFTYNILLKWSGIGAWNDHWPSEYIFLCLTFKRPNPFDIEGWLKFQLPKYILPTYSKN